MRGVTPIRQMEIQGACAVLAANPISQNSHARPVILPPPPQLHDDTQQRCITPVNNEDQEAGNEFGMMPQLSSLCSLFSNRMPHESSDGASARLTTPGALAYDGDSQSECDAWQHKTLFF